MERAVHETGQIPDVKTLADRLAIYDVFVRHSRGVAASAAWQCRPLEALARGTRDATDPLYAHLDG